MRIGFHMRLHSMGEQAFIERLKRHTSRPRGVIQGIGDDAAVMAWGHGRLLLFTTDMLVEGVHFRRGERDAEGIGHKALAVCVSDIAAMGGRPREAVVSLGAPADTRVSFLELLYKGILKAAHRYGASIVGGDTVRSPRLVISIALLGEVSKKDLILRKGARPGDELWVTGGLGGNPKGRILKITPRLAEARRLVKKFRPRAMMDLSDGLWTDVGNLSRASRVGARIYLGHLPVHPFAVREARRLKADPKMLALTGGEEFELLFAVSPSAGARLARAGRRALGVKISKVGEIVPRSFGIKVYAKGCVVKVKESAVWKHF
ncbi:MAG: thiamine-monophosphate kinase [Candidatus Omnitrophica bacterium]|nr:thiamine-monophosphate kinase [Candidatus Omnitrophota bacterium]